MNPEQLARAVTAALSSVRHPDTNQDVMASGHVQGLEARDEGEVRFSFVLQKGDPGSLVKEARRVAESVEGVRSVKVNVQLPQAAPEAPAKRPLRPGSVPPPTPKPGLLPHVEHVIAVSSGKGGVGKSMVSTNLAAGAAAAGLRVGLLDADIYGPNIPLMFGENRRPRVTGDQGRERIAPLEAHGVRLMSLGFLLEKEQPAIMRGPLISGILKQFIEQVEWGALDLLVVDMPPGTGDAQLSLVQSIDLDGVVMVTTPQDVATGDVRRAIRMFERVNTRVLGIVENMSGFVCPHCDEITEIFGSGGGERLAVEFELPFLGRIPIDAAVANSGDLGTPTVLMSPASPAGRALQDTLKTVLEAVQLQGAVLGS